jgi:hypothetical protein
MAERCGLLPKPNKTQHLTRIQIASRKDAKSQRKEGSRKIMSFVSIKQYSENPVHPV